MSNKFVLIWKNQNIEIYKFMREENLYFNNLIVNNILFANITLNLRGLYWKSMIKDLYIFRNGYIKINDPKNLKDFSEDKIIASI